MMDGISNLREGGWRWRFIWRWNSRRMAALEGKMKLQVGGHGDEEGLW